MKRLLTLTLVLVVGAAGLGCTSMFRRGEPCNSCGPVGDPYTTTPAVTTDGGYLPAPG